jgi:hypothetical protein
MAPSNLRLTLRTLLAYLDDTLEPAQALVIGQKLNESQAARELADRIRRITRKRGLSVPSDAEGQGASSDPNTVAGYLSDSLTSEQLAEFERICLESDVHLAEVAASHQILTLVLSEQMRIPPTAYRRMYELVSGPASIPNRPPATAMALGTAAEKGPDDREELDTAYLLGMKAYSKSQPVRVRILQWAAAAALLLGFALAAYLAWPRMRPERGIELARRPEATVPAAKPSPTAPAPTTPPVPTTPSVPSTPAPPTTQPGPKPATPPPAAPVDPPPVREELLPKVPAVQAGRIAIALNDTAEDQLLLAGRNDGGMETWGRVPPRTGVMSTDRLMALPGYRSRIRYDTGLTVELWGNLPELIPIGVLQTSVVPTIADAGYDADITLDVGRIYLRSSKPSGAKVRVRFRREIWEIVLPDEKAMVAVEVLHAPTPGPLADAPTTAAVLYANAGQPVFSSRSREAVKVPPGHIMLWTNTGPGLEGPRVPDRKRNEPAGEYFDRIPIYPNEASATATRKVLDGFAKRLPEAKSLGALLAEKNLGAANGTTAEDMYSARFAIFAAAALAKYPPLAESACDPDRAFAREAALVALRAAFGNDPGSEAAFRLAAEQKFRLSKDQMSVWLRRLPGLAPSERVDFATLDQLLADLAAPEIVVRELAFFVLLNDLDPESRKQRALAAYDAGAPVEAREAGVKAWRKRIEEIKAAIREMPAK